MKKNKDHLIINTFTGDFECLNCGQKQSVPLPVYLTVYIGMMKVWAKMHKNCKQSVLENPALDEKEKI